MNSISQKAKEIFLSLVDDFQAAEWDSRADEACQGDIELSRRVHALLLAHAEPDSRLEHVAIDFPLTLDQHLTEKPGTQIGPYKLLEEIGEGGMGVVYMAEQRQPVRRKVALKIIKPGMDTRQVVLRFEAERQALALMEHPNIAHVLDAGSSESGRPYFVMELVRGIPITQYCDQHHLNTRQRLELFTSVCHAVQHAHLKGIIHRDIKPSNVMVTLHDGMPVPKIIDFGVAKAINRQLTERTLFTNYAQMIGTPLYMSPEQAEMSGLDVDTRTDIYSLGVLLYELLTGSTPFDRDRLQDATYDELRWIIREEEPPRPSTRVSTLKAEMLSTVSGQRGSDPRKLSRLFRGELDWIVMRALEKDRTRRYETPSAFAADVQRFLNQDAVEACPPSTTYKLKKFVRRHKAGVTTATMVLTVLILGIVTASWQAFRAESALAAEQIAHNNASEQRLVAQTAETQARMAEAAVRKLAEQTRRQLYISDMNRAQQEWNDANIGGVLNLLQRHQPEGNQQDLRSFEWYYLGELCRRGATTSTLHLPHSSYCMQYSPDGQLVATGQRDGTVRLWDANTRRLLYEFDRHPSWVSSIAFSPDGKRLASGGHNGTVKLWEIQSRTLLRTLDEHPEAVLTLAFSTDGKMLASNWLKDVRLWDVAAGTLLASLAGHKNTITDVVFSPDGKTLASGGADSMVILWDSRTHEKVATFDGRGQGFVTSIAIAPDGGALATATRNGRILAWDVASQRRLRAPLSAHEAPIFSLAFSPDGKSLASGSLDGTAKLWNAANHRLLDTLKGHSAGLYCVAFAPDGQTLATTSEDKTVKFWDLTSQPRSQTLKEPVYKNQAHIAAVYALAISPDGKTLASCGPENGVKLWDLATDQLRSRLEGHTRRIWDATFSPDGKLLASGGLEKLVDVWNVDTGEVVATLTGHTDSITSVAFSPDGKTLASGDRNQTVILWNLATAEKRISLNGDKRSMVSSLLFSLDGKMLVTAGYDGSIRCWNAATGELLKTITGHSGEIYCLALSPDGQILASGSRDDTIKLWELATGKLRGTLSGHTSLIHTLAFAPDGQTLASGSWDRTVKIWDLQSCESRITLKPQADLVKKIAFSSDGKTLAAGTQSGVIQLWRAANENEMISLLQTIKTSAEPSEPTE